jgi:hypothetical protein
MGDVKKPLLIQDCDWQEAKTMSNSPNRRMKASYAADAGARNASTTGSGRQCQNL